MSADRHDVRRLRKNSFVSGELWMAENSCTLEVQESESQVSIEFRWRPPVDAGPITAYHRTERFEYRMEARNFWLEGRSLFFGSILRKAGDGIDGEDADTFVAVSAKPGDPGPPAL